MPRYVHAQRVPLHPNVSRRSAHPSIRGERSKVANPGCRHAPRERDGLFDIVRRSASAVAVIVPSPPAGEGGSMLPRAMMGEGYLLETNPSPIRVRGRTIVPSPARGEGIKGARQPPAHFGQTKPSVSANANNQPAAVGNDRRLRSIVFGLLFTMDGATPTCRRDHRQASGSASGGPRVTIRRR